MARRHVKLMAVLALSLVSALSIARVAMAGGGPTAQEIADECGAAIMSAYGNAAVRLEDQYDAAIDALNDASDDGATPAQLMKLAATSAGKMEKDTFKAAGQMEKIIDKCLAKLERLGATTEVIDQVEDLREAPFVLAITYYEHAQGLVAEVADLLVLE